MTDWQPIETAPKDGREIDLWGSYPGRNPKPRRVPECYWHKKTECFRSQNYDRDGWSRLRSNFIATHWMYPPEGPQS